MATTALEVISAPKSATGRQRETIGKEGNPYVSYESICRKVYRKVLNSFELSNDVQKRFLPHGAASQILNQTLLRDLFEVLAALPGFSSARSQVDIAEKIQRVKKRDLHGLLAVVLFSSCDVAAASAFEEYLILPSNEQWKRRTSDRKRTRQEPLGILPLEPADAVAIFGSDDVETLDKIASHQTKFCPVQLWKNRERTLDHLHEHRFPYLEEETIGEGYSGKVYRVVIAKGFFVNKDEDSVNDKDVQLARKDYDSRKNNQFVKLHFGMHRRIQEEKEIIQLLNKFRSHENIVQSLGAYEIGTTYSLFLELAADDLKHYLSSRDERLTSAEAKAQFLQCAAGLASGLNFLHEGIKLPDCDKAVCYHLDLKPDNVLVYKTVDEHGDEQMTWKIADFSEARLKTRGQQDQIRHRPRKWFLLQKELSAFSGTQNRRLQGTYLAPESEQSEPVMGAHSDVWSLGCIVSVLLTYLQSGWRGVGKYSDARIDERQVQQSDQFFRPTLSWSDFKLNTQVPAQHQYLVRQAQKRELRDVRAVQGESEALKHFLDFLEENVLIVNWKTRQANPKATAKTIKAELERLVKFYTSPSKYIEETRNDTSQPPFLDRLSALIWSIFPYHPVTDPMKTNEEDSWFMLPKSIGIKASTIPSNETIMAFWSNEYIRLYTPDKLNVDPNSKGVLNSYGVSDKLGQTSCYWESVDLNSECLIASTNRSSFECYFYEIENRDTMGVTLSSKYRVFQRLPRIRRVAISPDNKWFVCVLYNEQDPDQPGTLYIAAMKDALQAAKQRSSNVLEENVISRVANSKSLIPWSDHLNLHSAAGDLTYLIISDDNIVYAVLQPSRQAEYYEHVIILHSFDIFKRQFRTINLKIPPMEYSNVSFFTTFTPFHKQNACAIVTREHGFHVQYFTDGHDTRDVVQSVYSHRILDIVLDHDDDTIYALGTKSADNDVLLLKFSLPQSDKDNIQITEVERLRRLLDDDDCTLSISSKDDKKYIAISVARGMIYRLNISK